ncbi:hypothetical protein FSP39_012661 [Pinctada imbricata]|uniref:C2H2-type domain-containing protein n=1 Tax=Pinctada imbricata TaxID=66713 RepID=A0AA89BX71_PINIB|nr:hypothetical protein FSP39_012661 [Pinctada imbricata]
MESDSSNQWLRYIQAARDRHEQNVEFLRADDGRIILQTIRKIKMGDHLCAWFSDPLAREMDIPILTLQNIQGSQCYLCGDCNQTYKFPNPLKSHIKYFCEAASAQRSQRQQTSGSPTGRLFRPFQDEIPTPSSHDNEREFKHSGLFGRNISHQSLSAFRRPGSERASQPHPNDPKSFNLLARASTIGERSLSSSLHLFSQSALNTLASPFKINNICGFVSPYLYSPNKLSSFTLRQPHLPTSLPSETRPTNHRTEDRLSFPLPSEVEGEPLDLLPKSFFANKSKKGHLCIYCGKLYSRKYGLKIHLRTHTGYKPLKCKVCLRPFGDPSNLNKHVRLHAEGETPYRCEFCGKVLVRRRDLERHLKSRHSGAESKAITKESKEASDGVNNSKDEMNTEIIVV